ncbi:MAG: GNAT family N-acetyltransferase [Acidimicrobiia bacterium]
MTFEIRPAAPQEAASFRRVMGHAFGFDPNEKTIDRFNSLWEPERSRNAYEGETMVATLGAFSLQLTVPGAVLPAGGTSMVAVLPSHRRQGLLRRMMLAHLNDVAEHEEPIAALWASESSIYGRFGFGTASSAVDITAPTAHRRFHRLAPEPASVELITSNQARILLPAIQDKIRPIWPGMYARTEDWWSGRWFLDPEGERDGATSLRFGVTSHGDGYVIYRQKEKWTAGNPSGEVLVSDLVAETPESWSGLWAFILNHDLANQVTANLRSPQDPLFNFLAAPRSTSLRPGDGIWVRLHDPVKALASRRYSVEGELVIEAHDPLDGRVHTLLLEAGPEGASCSKTDREPEIVLDFEDLGAVYLGWSRLRSFARAGRLSGDHQALARADAMFSWDPAPWCPEIF